MRDQQETIRHGIGATGSLTINNVSGSVRLVGTTGHEAVVVARGSNGRTPAITVRRSEGSLLVEPERKSAGFLGGTFAFGPSSVDFEVQVPRSARVEVSAVSADVDGEGLVGEQHYKTVSGDIDLSASGGRLSVSTVSGDARIIADEPVELTATTTSGDLRVRSPRLELLRLRTVSGDVDVTGALRVGAEHAVETVSGDLLVEAHNGLTVDARRALDISSRGGRSAVVGDGAARLTFRSMSGEVVVSGGDADADAFTTAAAEAPPRPHVPRQPPTPAAAQATEMPETPEMPEMPSAMVDAPTEEVPAIRDDDSLEILRRLERGEIDVDEATRLLEGMDRG